jgi:hypothetical protein
MDTLQTFINSAGLKIVRIDHHLSEPDQIGHEVGKNGCVSISAYQENGGLGPELWLCVRFEGGEVAFTAARHYWIFCAEVPAVVEGANDDD